MTAQQTDVPRRTPLSRERVLRAAVALADEGGIETLSMRRLAQELDVVPMALYKHVAHKDELLDGVVDLVVGEIPAPAPGDVEQDWQGAVRRRVLGARHAMLSHPWAAQVIESRGAPTPAVMTYLNSVVGMFRAGGFSVDLTHHVMHTMGSRILGFSQELFDDSAEIDPEVRAAGARAMAPAFPHLAEIALAVAHDDASVVGSGCDDQAEFEFALDLLLDGFERLRRRAAGESAPA
ncbi:TetR family transcriptional regulator [Cellulomonas chitinilytica]|uniref:TetR family transcriptional regulator n=1 Tax=Cellulomonas chitinilytica TaxID=398759 RepID=A0A919P5C6_9CELL|nr:TetR/AcrR family transcriptional regulator [Cellulomonas chitinilytica]GIG21664.1 TetR family transcriptional regulator [Cellulomonas chitinilytica]